MTKNIKILNKSFFNQPTLIVAEKLLGKYIVRKVGKKEIAIMITEVEAYDGHKDKASHAHKGKTTRNEIMFGEAGYWYVYLVYGMHYMLNIVTGDRDFPAAVLIRGGECNSTKINGPGKLTKFLKINKKFDGEISTQKTNLWIEDRGVKIDKKRIKKTPRIGVNYAGPVWSKKLYRFVLI